MTKRTTLWTGTITLERTGIRAILDYLSEVTGHGPAIPNRSGDTMVATALMRIVGFLLSAPGASLRYRRFAVERKVRFRPPMVGTGR